MSHSSSSSLDLILRLLTRTSIHLFLLLVGSLKRSLYSASNEGGQRFTATQQQDEILIHVYSMYASSFDASEIEGLHCGLSLCETRVQRH
jgi:hypothetical protein